MQKEIQRLFRSTALRAPAPPMDRDERPSSLRFRAKVSVIFTSRAPDEWASQLNSVSEALCPGLNIPWCAVAMLTYRDYDCGLRGFQTSLTL